MAARAPQVALRATRLHVAHPRVTLPRRVNCRYQSTSGQQEAAKGSSHLIAGIAGGSVAFLAGYAWYHFSGVKSFVNTAHSTKATIDNVFRSSTKNAPKPDEAISWLRETVQSYTKMIPGAQSYVDSAFDDLETINKQHGPEVEKIIKETYDELKDVTKAGASYEALAQTWTILQTAMKKIGHLAKDASEDLLKNHPELKEKVGSRFDQLKSMGDQFGPEAKKQVEETWSQVQEIVKSGPLNPDNINKIQKLVQEKSEKLQQYGDQAWQKGLEEAKPILDKYPQVKEFVEKNKDQLMKGDIGQIWQKLQEAAKKGDSDEALKVVKEEAEKAKSKAKDSAGSGSVPTSLTQLFSHIPGAEDLGEKFHQLQQLYQKRGKDAEELVKGAVEDIKQVLAKKMEEGEKLKDKAEQDVKK